MVFIHKSSFNQHNQVNVVGCIVSDVTGAGMIIRKIRGEGVKMRLSSKLTTLLPSFAGDWYNRHGNKF